jgi:hypothetical protein
VANFVWSVVGFDVPVAVSAGSAGYEVDSSTKMRMVRSVIRSWYLS